MAFRKLREKSIFIPLFFFLNVELKCELILSGYELPKTNSSQIFYEVVFGQ